jgi:aromatic ring-opening dioxygenase catalytic subunit (LigB family)
MILFEDEQKIPLLFLGYGSSLNAIEENAFVTDSETMQQKYQNPKRVFVCRHNGNQGAFDLAVPTPEQYLPLLYALALKEEDEKITLFNDNPFAGSITMTSLKIS